MKIKKTLLGLLAGSVIAAAPITAVSSVACTNVLAAETGEKGTVETNPIEVVFDRLYTETIKDKGDTKIRFYHFTADRSVDSYSVSYNLESGGPFLVALYEKKDDGSGYQMKKEFQQSEQFKDLKPGKEYMIAIRPVFYGYMEKDNMPGGKYSFRVFHKPEGLVVAKAAGSWILFNNGKEDRSFTGAAKSTNGNWIYVKDGVYRTGFTGVAKSTKGNWIFLRNSRYDAGFTGVAKSTKGNWIYVKNGRYDTSFTGVAKSTKGNWIYVKNGRYDTSYTGIAKSTKGNRLYIVKGRWQRGFTGKYKNYNIKNGYVI